jgi:hypothetical protein
MPDFSSSQRISIKKRITKNFVVAVDSARITDPGYKKRAPLK